MIKSKKVFEHAITRNQFKIKYVMSPGCFWQNMPVLFNVTSVQFGSEHAICSYITEHQPALCDLGLLDITDCSVNGG